MNSVPKLKINEKTLPARSRPQNPKKIKSARADGRVRGRRAEKKGSGVVSALAGVCCSGCTQRQKGCCRRRRKNCSRARLLASSLAPSFVVDVVVPLLRLLYAHTRSEICYCCLHPGSSTLPSRSTTFVYKTVEPSMSSFKLLWWYQINVTLADGRTN